jgi:uncharacterized protein YndB with AHSA1/START domain
MLGMTEDGRYALRFERHLPHPRAKVWRALTDKAELRAWFVSVVDYDRTDFEPAVGAELTFAYTTGAAEGHGEVTGYDPPKLLEYTWDGETLRWELAEDGEDACTLVFVTTFDDESMSGPLSDGWSAGLDQLANHLREHPAQHGPALQDHEHAHNQ